MAYTTSSGGVKLSMLAGKTRSLTNFKLFDVRAGKILREHVTLPAVDHDGIEFSEQCHDRPFSIVAKSSTQWAILVLTKH